jgi:hypothetical protein
LVKHKWDVELEDGSIITLKSQQLLKPKVHNAAVAGVNAHLPVAPAAAAPPPPPLVDTDVSSSHNEIEEEEAEELQHNLENMQLNNDSEDDSEDDVEDDVEELMMTPRTPNAGAAADPIEEMSESDEEALEEEEEEGRPEPPRDYVMPQTGATVDALEEPTEEDYHTHGEVDLEPEDVYQAKWERYITDKAALLSNGWTIAKASTGPQGISIGATVSTKGAAHRRRHGEVVSQTEVNDRKLWIVDFGGDDPEPMRPQQLLLVEQNAEQYVWNLVEESNPEIVTEEYRGGIGLCGFDFGEAFKPPSSDGEVHSYPYLKLLQKMWPGDWKQQLPQLNTKAAAENASHSGNKNWRDINPVSEQEWWVFIGILISAGPQGKGGEMLWEKHSHRGGALTMTAPINYGPDGLDIMPLYRFKHIKACFPWSFQDKTKADEEAEGHDPWNIVMLMVGGYNSNRHDWVAASVRKVLDESMSAFRPRTSKTGGWPNISFILRKPEPLGTEFKTIACAVTGTCAVVCCIIIL